MAAAVLAAGVAGCGKEGAEPAATSPSDFAIALKDRVSTDAMMAHLKKLQDIVAKATAVGTDISKLDAIGAIRSIAEGGE